MNGAFRVGLVIPFYNESSRFQTAEFRQFVTENSINFCLVNDGSTDQTAELLEKLGSEFPDKISVLNLPKNQGKAEAVRQGCLALAKTDGFKAIGYIDADFATPLSEMIELEQVMIQKKAVMCFGSRILKLGSVIERSKMRHYLGRIMATAASSIMPIPVYDTQCGAKLIHSAYIQELFNEPFINRWLFDVEIFLRLFKTLGLDEAKKRIFEVPLNVWIEKGESKIKFLDLVKVPVALFKIWRHYAK